MRAQPRDVISFASKRRTLVAGCTTAKIDILGHPSLETFNRLDAHLLDIPSTYKLTATSSEDHSLGWTVFEIS